MKVAVRDQGLALISVLWVVAALSVIVGSEIARVRTDIQLTHTHVGLAQARAHGEAGIYFAIHAILASRQSPRPGTPEGPLRLTWDDAETTLAIRNEAGKIDVNAARAELIESVLIHAGVGKDRAISLATARRRPVRRRFHSVEEYVTALEVPNAIGRRLIHLFTVYSGRDGVNPLVAGRDVLLSIPRILESEVNRYLALRSRNPFHTPDLGAGHRYFTDRLSAVYTITARTSLDGITTTTAAVIRLSSLPGRPYTILRWRSSAGFEET